MDQPSVEPNSPKGLLGKIWGVLRWVVLWPIIKWVVPIFLLLALFSAGSLWAVYEYDRRTDWLSRYLGLPSVLLLKTDDLREQTDVSGDDGRRVACFSSPEHRIKIASSEDIPVLFEQAIIAQEDQRFYEHHGVDYIAIGRAAMQNTFAKFSGSSRRIGASTLSMQIARNLLLRDSTRSYERKLKEAILALKIERQFTKREILLIYVNMPYLGRGQNGIEAGSRSYFGKPSKDLAIEEVAFIVSLISKPGLLDRENGTSKESLERRETLLRESTKRTRHVIDRMEEMGFIKSADEYNRAQARAGKLNFQSAISGCSVEMVGPYFIEEIRRRHMKEMPLNTGGLQIFLPIDTELQRVADEALRQGLNTYRARHVYSPEKLAKLAEAANMPLEEFKRAQAEDRESIRGLAFGVDFAGRVRFMLGGEDYRKSKFNVATQGFRQPGSTFKAFTYAAQDEALLEQLVLAGVPEEELLSELDKRCLVKDAPIAVSRGRGKPPKWINNFRTNSQPLYRGLISCKTALAESRNTAAIRAGQAAGVKRLVALARRLGVGVGNRKYDLQPYPTTAIGASDVVPIDMSAYLSFVNGGYKVPLIWEHDICKNDEHGVSRSIITSESGDPMDASVKMGRLCARKGALPTSYERVLSPVVAEHMKLMLMGTVNEATGTGHSLRTGTVIGQDPLQWDPKAPRVAFPLDESGEIAAKTGTATNANGDTSDVWFIVLVAGEQGKPDTGMLMVFWMGKTTKSSLGPRETGGRNLVPVAAKIMRFLQEKRGLLQPGNKFEPIIPLDVVPPSTPMMVFPSDDPDSGEIIDPEDPNLNPTKLQQLPPLPKDDEEKQLKSERQDLPPVEN